MAACILAAAALVLTGTMTWSTGAQAATRYEGGGYATSDDAVTAYMTAMTHSDIDGMRKTFAIETFANHFSLKDNITRTGSYTWYPEEPWIFPAGSFNEQLTTYQRLTDVTLYIVSQYAVLSGWDIDAIENGGGAIVARTPTDVDALYQKLSNTFNGRAFSSITSWTIVPLSQVDPKAFQLYQSDQNQQNLDALRRAYGTSEISDFAVSISRPTGNYTLTGETARYGDRWWILSFQGNFGALEGIQAMHGGLMPQK